MRYLTSSPLEVNITIQNSMPIGGLDHAFLCVSLDKVASPENEYSAPPGNLVILTQLIRRRTDFHSTQFSLRSHFARPWVQRHFPSAVLRGVGTRIITSVAYNLFEKFALTAISYETRVRECSVMMGCTRNGSWIFDVARYLQRLELRGVRLYRMSSNSPSGGMKEMVLSESNFPNLTH